MNDGEKHRVDEKHRILDNLFDWWLPLLWFAVAPFTLCVALFKAGIAALATVVVFLLAAVPQMKIKRAELSVDLQKRFHEFAGDYRALNGAADTRKSLCFFLKFWGLQQLEFALWRYGMLANDTYAHWVIRRLISFRMVNPERYYGLSPKEGWGQVKSEFVRTDFEVFVDAAISLGDEVEREVAKVSEDPARDWTSDQLNSAYDKLHPRVERLLIATAVHSAFIRWLRLQRPNLPTKNAQVLAQSAFKPLKRESGWWRVLGLTSAIVLIAACAVVGYYLRPIFGITDTTKPLSIFESGANSGAMILDPNPVPVMTFIVRFPEEESCMPPKSSSVWPSATLQASGRVYVRELASKLAACSTKAKPLRMEVVGFASSSSFMQVCGLSPQGSDEANLALANARGDYIAKLLERDLPRNYVTARVWKTFADMESGRLLIDTLPGGNYDAARGSLNRRAEIRVLQAGDCSR